MNELEQLIKEAKEIKEFLKKVPQFEERLIELIGSWGKEGLIEKKKRLIEESNFPIFYTSSWVTIRIKNIDDNWIYLKNDGSNEVIQYKKINGWKKCSRNEYGKIDAEKAIKIWSEHNEQH